jgi:hypothetical protein
MMHSWVFGERTSYGATERNCQHAPPVIDRSHISFFGSLRKRQDATHVTCATRSCFLRLADPECDYRFQAHCY